MKSLEIGMTPGREQLLAQLEYEFRMGEMGTALDRENVKINETNMQRLAERIEGNVISLANIAEMNNAVKLMVERHKEIGGEEPLYGPVFTTGVSGGIGMMMLLPARDQDRLRKDMKLSEVVHGTPILIQFQDEALARELKDLPYDKRLRRAKAVMKQKVERVRNREAKANVNWGGWGSLPWYLINRQHLTQSCEDENGLAYELSVSMGLLGSAFTLKNENLEKISELMKTERNKPAGITLPMFAEQIESALSQLGKVWREDSEDPVQVMADISPDLIGHSMGAYLAIIIAKRSRDSRRAIEAIKATGRARIIADKPVMVGPRWPGAVPAWIDDIRKNKYYGEQVKLQSGWRGKIIKMGLGKAWRNRALGGIRGGLGRYFPGVKNIFKGFITPERMWDGNTIYPAHLCNYFWDPDYHRVCVELLDGAPPIMTDETVAKNRAVDRVGSMGLSGLYFVLGGGDAILKHMLTGGLVEALGTRDEQYVWTQGGAHHMNLKEIVWAMRLKRVREQNNLSTLQGSSL